MGMIVPPPFDAPQQHWDAFIRYHDRQRKFLLIIFVISVLLLLATLICMIT